MFKIGDTIIYALLTSLLVILGIQVVNFKSVEGSKVEIYVNNKLYMIQELKKEKHEFIVPTDLGGIKVLLKDEKVWVVSSNSPKKLIIKQGAISKVGDTLIGVPDKVLIKIVGETDIDYIIK